MTAALHQFLQEILRKCKAGNFIKPENVLEREELVLNNFLLKNQFLSIFDLYKNDFIYAKNINNVLGCSAQEFTLGKLISIIPPLELFLVVEYGTIAYELMASGKNISTMSHAYCVHFPLFKNNQNQVSYFSRKCMIFQLNNEIPATILEFWEDITFQTCNRHVKWALYSPSPEESVSLNKEFFEIWQRKIGIRFSPRELETIIIGEAGQSAKEIASIMGLKQGTVEEYFSSMKKKIKKVMYKLNTDLSFTKGININIDVPYAMTRKELIQYAYTFGLLPDNILKQHFKEKVITPNFGG